MDKPSSRPSGTALPEDWLYQQQRARLVEELRRQGIRDEPVLAAIGRVPRHRMVDPGLVKRAYRDEALPIGHGQTISQPYTVAYQTVLLDAHKDDRILEVGTGSGYQAAVLCELGARVFSIERLHPLYERTRHLLAELGYHVVLRHGDGALGWAASAPYDGILVTAGAEEIPKALLEQLREPDGTRPGGRLVIPVGHGDSQTMNRIVCTGPNTYERFRYDAFRFVPLLHGVQRNPRL